MKILLLSILFAIFTVGSVEADGSIVINELMASNSNSQADPQGQYDDWIEIHNNGSDVLQIGGMYLTDDLSDPTKWQIPLISRDNRLR